jgi:hypothetical protein
VSRAKVRPCKKGCGYPALKGRQFCQWHALMRQSTDAQVQAAADRRERQLGHDNAVFQARVPKEKWPEGERWCAGCQSFVPLFYISGSRCKACTRQAAHESRVEKTYGITPERYEEIFARQGRRCGICRSKPASIRFAVDHDHQSGAVRGILCKRCNHDLLGGAHDSIDLMWAAMKYLLAPPAQDLGYQPNDAHFLTLLRDHLDAKQVLAAAKRGDLGDAPF